MATWLRQSTAVDVSMGPFVDNADGNTVESALTITQPDIRLKKASAAWAQKNAAQTLSHEENGWYEVALDTTDTNTLGNLLIAIHESGALPVWREFQVVTAQVWDSYFSTDLLDVSVTQVAGQTASAAGAVTFPGTIASTTNITAGTLTTVTTATNLTNLPTIPANWLTAAGTAADFTTEIQTGLATAAALVTVDTVVDAIKVKTDQLTFTVANRLDAQVLGMAVDVLDDAALAADAVAAIAAGVEAEVVEFDGEAGITVGDSLRMSNAALAGKLSGAGTGTEAVRSIGDSKDRLIYTVDSSGNRSVVTRDLT